MIEEQFREKFAHLRSDAIDLIDAKVEKALKCGAIDLESYIDNYVLPRIVMSAIGNEIEYEFRPIGKEQEKECDNLKLFL